MSDLVNLQERLNLLHRITVAVGANRNLDGIFEDVVRNVEETMPVDFACLCLYDREQNVLTVKCVGAKSQVLARDLAMPETARIHVEGNGLAQCVKGQWVYEADITHSKFPFPQRLSAVGLRSFVAAPLQVPGRVFGALIAARIRAHGFGDDECVFLKQLSEHVASAAHHAQLYGDCQKAYDDLRRTQDAMVQEERLKALGQLAGGVAHDINNALSPIMLYTESLLSNEEGLSPRGRGFLEIIQRAVGDIGHTVGRLGDFSRPSLLGGSPVLINLNTLIPQVLDLSRARWGDVSHRQGVEIEVQTDLQAELPRVLGVASEIRDALINLIFNAVDAMPEGGRLTLTTRVSGSDEARRVLLAVIDTGSGMDEESRRRCLEPFFTTKGERGSGLGLAMVYGFAQRHGVDVGIDSVLHAGTTVRLDFPAASGTAEETIAGASPTPACLRLLFVDDDLLLLTAMTDMLRAEGHTVTPAKDGVEGLMAFRAALAEGEGFDAVITDLGMPLMNGAKVAAGVKMNSLSTPVIMLTGWGRSFSGGLPDHVDAVLTKPPTLSAVRATLARLCGIAPGARGEAA